MTKWRRPYRDPVLILSGILPVVGCVYVVLFAAMTIASWPDVSVPYTVAMGVGFAVALTLTWRLHRTALVIGDEGVRLRWLLLTRTVAWPDIREFQTRPDRLGLDIRRDRMFLVRHDGTSVRTPIVRNNPVPRYHFGARWIRPDRYDLLLTDLNRRLREPEFTP